MTSGLSQRLRSAMRDIFSRKHDERDLDTELRFDLEQRTRANVAAGMSPKDAKFAAMREFGSLGLAKEECRDARGTNLVENAFNDFRYALRVLIKKPGFTAVAILTLALGIGANSAIFSVVDAVLLKPLPFPDSNRLLLVYEGIPDIGFPKTQFSAPDLQIFQREQQSFESTATYQNKRFEISGAGEPERVIGARGQWNLFDVLGVHPILGRTFTRDEDAPGHDVTILSYALWQGKFGGSPAAIGKTLNLDRVPYTIVGVLPRDFRFPLPGAYGSSDPAELWVPMAFTKTELEGWGTMFNNDVVARLKPGVTVQQAAAEIATLAPRIESQYPAEMLKAVHNIKLVLQVVPLQTDVVGSVKPLLLILQIAVALVLLIACANVALLLLARASARSREIAIRIALGASRGRLVLQLLAESLLLATGGAAAGFALASWSKTALLSFVPADASLPNQVPMDSRVLLFTLGIAIASALIFGLVPAFEATRSGLQTPLQEGGRGNSTSRGRHRVQNIFVITEFALALILMIGAGLLLRTFTKLLRTDPGFQPQHVLTMTVPLPAHAYPQAAQIRSFYLGSIARSMQLAGIVSAAISNDVPMHGNEIDAFWVEAPDGSMKAAPAIRRSWILGDYLHTMGIPLLRGRAFTPDDRAGTQRVAIISENLAKRVWPDGDAIGKHIRVEGSAGPWTTIVGIAGDVPDSSLAAERMPHVYSPYLQETDAQVADNIGGGFRTMTLAARTSGDPANLSAAMVSELHQLDPSLAVTKVRTMQSDLNSTLLPQRFNATLVGIYAGVALLLALIGIYGVLAYTVSQQMHEIGVRMAIGAQRRDILALVLERGFILATIGAAIGLAGAWVVTRFMATLLYAVQPRDPLTFAGVTLILAFTALLACYLPARRATRVDPIIALRHE
jgi:predicted permease